MNKEKDFSLIKEANETFCKEAQKITSDALFKVLHNVSLQMKCGYSRADK